MKNPENSLKHAGNFDIFTTHTHNSCMLEHV